MNNGHHIHSIGRWRNGPEKTLFSTYAKRLRSSLIIHEYKSDDDLISGVPADENKQAQDYLIACDLRGTLIASPGFAKLINKARRMGRGRLHYMIGGADGLPGNLISQADAVISFGRVTWPHMLMRAMLSEQIYRAETILSGHPYHH